MLPFPLPKRWRETGETLALPGEGQAGLGLGQAFGLDWVWALGDLAVSAGAENPTAESGWLHLSIHGDRSLPQAPGGYRLRVTNRMATIEARDPSGLFYGCLTLADWAQETSATGHLRGLECVDAPDFARRGFMLDISRDRIPTLTEAKRRIDTIARLKGNHLEWYMEHAFAYVGHETVWQGLDPWTAGELRELVAYAKTRGVECVPNQNTFGHMHRWLRHDRYNSLAEEPGGMWHAFDHVREPFSLCPTDPGSLELVRDLCGQLLPCFEGEFFQAGFDETMDVGRGRSRSKLDKVGLAGVYGEYMQAVAAMAREHGKRLAFWADILIDEPKIADWVPSDSVAVLWGYEADHNFAEPLETLRTRGLDFWIAPGTSTWQSLTGRWTNAKANIESAIRQGREFGAGAAVLTDWGDYGHWQPPLLTEPSLCLHLGLAWNGEQALSDTQVVAALKGIGLAGPVAEALIPLQNAYLRLEDGATNATGPFYCLRYPPHGPNTKESWLARAPQTTDRGLTAYIQALETTRSALAGVESLEAKELLWSAQAGQAAAQITRARLSHSAPGPKVVRAFEEATQGLEQLWTERARPGGWVDARRKWLHALSETERSARGD